VLVSLVTPDGPIKTPAAAKAIYHWPAIRGDHPHRAAIANVSQPVRKVVFQNPAFPEAWHPLTPNVRRCRLSRFPYGVLYVHEPDGIVVVAVMHMHRNPDYWRDRLSL
jgi:hypothetical protein